MSGPLVAPALPAAAGGKPGKGVLCARVLMATACGWEPSEGLQAPEELGWGGCQLGNSSTAGLVLIRFPSSQDPRSSSFVRFPLPVSVVTGGLARLPSAGLQSGQALGWAAVLLVSLEWLLCFSQVFGLNGGLRGPMEYGRSMRL